MRISDYPACQTKVLRNRGSNMTGNDLSSNPWKTDDSGFPRSGSASEQLAFCLNYAVLAPSIHNSQPWLFRLLDDAVELYLDRSFALPATDPDAREMTISCGAALTNLLVAIHHFGYEGWVQYAPEQSNPDMIARVRLGRARTPHHQDESLFRSIRRRRTVRRPFQARPVPGELLRRLIWIASEYGCWIHFAEAGPDRETVADLINQAHQIQSRDREYQAERIARVGSRDFSVGNGASGDSSRNGSSMRSANGNSLDIDTTFTKQWIERDRELIQASPVLFALGSSEDTPVEWVRAGQALQHVLLHAESVNVSASFLNQPCQIPHLREQLRQITGRSGPPQVLLRMGYGTGTEPSTRRPVKDVILSPEFA
jgi:hypothetical protein